ncbi:MAG: 23S rRNA (guanosine(2251)-2'-O)-methyltransferase RlmB [Alphaproteobacteria bacterium]|nr:MAG: 23S rRNA (guanosine(2251)-2'-O)-methyltransferase RlmB [Alphaproteobacteria bacterium]
MPPKARNRPPRHGDTNRERQKNRRKQRPAAKSTRAPGGQGLRLYGVHAVSAALANPKRRFRHLWATRKSAENLTLPTGLTVDIRTSEEISELLPLGAVHQGLALEAEPLPQPALEAVLAQGTDAPLMVLDQVTDPHNIGAILRSAAAFGAAAVVVQDRHAPDITGVLAKSASGALEVTPLIRVTNLARALDQVREAGYFCIGLAGEAEETFMSFDVPARVALVMGAEGPGLRRLTRERCDILLKLPTQGPISSLNVSNAAAVALYAVQARAS